MVPKGAGKRSRSWFLESHDLLPLLLGNNLDLFLLPSETATSVPPSDFPLSLAAVLANLASSNSSLLLLHLCLIKEEEEEEPPPHTLCCKFLKAKRTRAIFLLNLIGLQSTCFYMFLFLSLLIIEGAETRQTLNKDVCVCGFDVCHFTFGF